MIYEDHHTNELHYLNGYGGFDPDVFNSDTGHLYRTNTWLRQHTPEQRRRSYLLRLCEYDGAYEADPNGLALFTIGNPDKQFDGELLAMDYPLVLGKTFSSESTLSRLVPVSMLGVVVAYVPPGAQSIDDVVVAEGHDYELPIPAEDIPSPPAAVCNEACKNTWGDLSGFLDSAERQVEWSSITLPAGPREGEALPGYYVIRVETRLFNRVIVRQEHWRDARGCLVLLDNYEFFPQSLSATRLTLVAKVWSGMVPPDPESSALMALPRALKVERQMSVVKTRYEDKTALVTGASAGIGVHFARQLAQAGCNLIITARREDRLVALSEELSSQFGVVVDVVVADLGHPDGPRQLFEDITAAGKSIDLLVNNAGCAFNGPFHTKEWELEQKTIQVNCMALVELTRRFLPQMLERGSGDILLVSSIAGMMPMPSLAIYSATKAFILRFGETVGKELDGTGVRMTVLSPGFTLTDFYDAAKMSPSKMRDMTAMPATRVAKIGLRSVAKGRRSVIAGLSNQWLAFSIQFVPLSIRLWMNERLLKLWGAHL